MRTSIPRIRSVTSKATGRQIIVFGPAGNFTPDWVRSAADKAIAEQKGRPLGGYAIVVWAMDGSSTCSAMAGSIPRALMPQFVKDRLLLETAKQWIAPADEREDKR